MSTKEVVGASPVPEQLVAVHRDNGESPYAAMISALSMSAREQELFAEVQA